METSILNIHILTQFLSQEITPQTLKVWPDILVHIVLGKEQTTKKMLEDLN